ncbi:acetylcholinesterase-like [Aplochiton taeniatus]
MVTVLLCLYPSHLSAKTPSELVVHTKHGIVLGTAVDVPGGGYVRAFLGIPYGKPPVGNLRFRAPEPAEGWTGPKHTRTFPNSCFQFRDKYFGDFAGAEMWNPNTEVSEDCLYLNVWTPSYSSTQGEALLLPPVLVWIYGGGFTTGTSSLDLYDGRFLSHSEGVVVVSMNYRVGALGFLSLPDNEGVRGNAGLLDQRLALQWVADNIAVFRGDPSKVTLFGESAGSASVGLHLLSPGSWGLFHRAVLQSGSPNARWATLTQAEAWNRSLNLGRLLGCPLSPPAALEQCLQSINPEELLNQQFRVLPEATSIIDYPFFPTVDRDFLPDAPEVLLQTGQFLKTDVMIGLNKDEGSYFLVYGAPGCDITSQSLLPRRVFLEGTKLAFTGFSNATRQTAIFHYTDWTDEQNQTKNRDSLSSIVGDMHFTCPVLQFAQRYTEHGGKPYLFLFDHRSSTNPWPAWMGTMHAYEIEFVFGLPLNRTLGYSEEEVGMSEKFMKHWANFARTGDPSIGEAPWPIFELDHQKYITLNSAPLKRQGMLGAQQCHFWNSLLPLLERVAEDPASCLHSDGTEVQRGASLHLLLALLLLGLTS